MHKNAIAGFTIVTVVLIAGIWLITQSLLEHYPIVNFPPKGSVIVALGDSLTVGVGASTPDKNYVSVLERRLNITIINKGISGDTTRDALARVDSDVNESHPNIVIVLLGGNDYLKRVPKAETFINLQSIIKTLQSKGAVVLLVGVQGGLITDKYDSDFKRVAKESGSIYVPNVLEGIIGNSKYLSDEIHPNDAGYLKIADKIAATLSGLILSITPTKSV